MVRLIDWSVLSEGMSRNSVVRLIDWSIRSRRHVKEQCGEVNRMVNPLKKACQGTVWLD